MQEWLTLPSRFPRIQSDAAIRIQASDLAEDPAVVLDSLAPLRDEILELSAMLEVRAARKAFPHRRRQLRLLHSLGRRILRASRAGRRGRARARISRTTAERHATLKRL